MKPAATSTIPDVRFKTADDLALDVIGELVASTPLDSYVALAKAARRR